ncbi:Glycosyltransferase involved in cell wall bisynthesis [Prevotellaceae bacterium MN60]|nr:Glycosyltransferase involved in cell wall bisynthesis [Prevotellaceae bacterium MN60]
MLRREKPQLVICDVMRFWVSTPALLFGKIFGVKMVGFAADIPQMYLHQYKGNISWIHSLQRKFYSSITTHYDAYIELSSYMDEHINPKNRPMIVVEGLVDSTSVVNHQDRQIERQTSSNNIILMYTGGLYEKYGVKMLIDAVASRKDSKIELWLLGKGELEEYLSTLNNANIKYFGYCPHDKVVTMQQQADFLINPRFSNEDYTKYSFPSKIMEYLVSGTPVISTRLKGIPDVYFNYIIPIEEETVEGLSVVLDQILQMDTDELNTLGNKGRDFVLKNKNNSVQAKRIVDWLETLE